MTYYSGIKVKRRSEEDSFHKQVAKYLTLAMPLDAVWTTFPAGGGGKIRGAQLKAKGLRPGVPDILWWWNGKFGGIELKAKRGSLSDAQEDFRDNIVFAGGSHCTAKTIAEIEGHLIRIGLPLRTRIGA